ncbi:MAG: propionyl-CoA synthetase, partial [Arenicellales bacterium]
EQPETFWADKASALSWYQSPKTILSEDEHGIHHWFADGEMNTAYMALDVHIEQGRGDQAALIYDSPVTDSQKTYSYLELRDEVALCAGMLKNLGVVKGDRVIIYMPMIPEAAISMLACARLGAIHSVVFGGFAAPELAVRIDDATPKVVISASCGIEIKRLIAYKPLIDLAIDLAEHTPKHCIVLQRPELKAEMTPTRDIDWHTGMANASLAACVPVKGSDLLYILYTSGTTGKPKGVVRENGGHAVAMHYSMKAIYNMDVGDVFWAASDVGWVVGHSYIVYAPLLAGCTTILYEGKPIMTPDAGAFWRVISDYGVKGVFSAPTAFRAIKKEDPNGELIKQYDVSCLETVFAAGERLDPPTYEWMVDKIGKPVIDHWWQTETGWAIAANLCGIEAMPVKAGSATMPVPGYHIEILDDAGKCLPANEQGNIAIKLPLPPSCLTTVWQDMDRFKSSYLSQYPGYYVSGDGGYFDDEGYLFIMGRVDDVINVAGHRLSTGEMEEIVGKHPAVAECAVIGRDDELKGQMPVGFVVIKSGEALDETALIKELIQMVRHDIGAVASFKEAYVIARLPKTRSGKILRKSMRQVMNGEVPAVPSTIEDPAMMDEFMALVKA